MCVLCCCVVVVFLDLLQYSTVLGAGPVVLYDSSSLVRTGGSDSVLLSVFFWEWKEEEFPPASIRMGVREWDPQEVEEEEEDLFVGR